MGLNELEWLSLSDWTADGAKNFPHSRKSLATLAENSSEALSAPTVDVPPLIKFKRLDKTARHIMQELGKIGDDVTFYLLKLYKCQGDLPGFDALGYLTHIWQVVDAKALDDKKKVRRAKFYYLRDRMNPLKNVGKFSI